jgi:hypothetical protein
MNNTTMNYIYILHYATEEIFRLEIPNNIECVYEYIMMNYPEFRDDVYMVSDKQQLIIQDYDNKH